LGTPGFVLWGQREGSSHTHTHTHTQNPAQCRWRMLPSLSLPRCCIWPPRTAASRRGHPDAALSSRFVIRVRPADAANAALPGSTCTLCTMRHDHRIRPRLLCTPAHHSHIGYTMLDIEDGDAFPHILIENECLHVTRRLIWSFCTMRRASRPGVVLCVRWLLRPPPVVLGRSSPDGPRAHRLDRCCVDINRNAHSCAGRHSASCPRQAQEQAAFFRRFSGRRPNAHIARIARVPRAQLPNCRRAHATHVPMRNGIALLRSGRRLRRADIGRRMDAEGAGRERAAVAARGAPAFTPAVGSRAPGFSRRRAAGHWPTRERRDAVLYGTKSSLPALWRHRCRRRRTMTPAAGR